MQAGLSAQAGRGEALTGAMSRRKGAKAELALFKLLTEDLALDRPLMRNLAQTRSGGADGEADALPGWAIEVKNVKQLARPSWWRQAITQAAELGNGAKPVLFYRRRKLRGQAERECWSAVIPHELLPASLVAPSQRVPGPPQGVDVSYADAVAVMAALALCEVADGEE